MMEAVTLSVSIDRDWRSVYAAIWRPEVFPRWASGLAQAGLEQAGDVWRAEGPDGPVTIRFTEENAFGVMDHAVDLGGGRTVFVPLRVIANGEGAEVMLTLFRQPEMTEETFALDQAWVARDLAALKAMLES